MFKRIITSVLITGLCSQYAMASCGPSYSAEVSKLQEEMSTADLSVKLQAGLAVPFATTVGAHAANLFNPVYLPLAIGVAVGSVLSEHSEAKEMEVELNQINGTMSLIKESKLGMGPTLTTAVDDLAKIGVDMDVEELSGIIVELDNSGALCTGGLKGYSDVIDLIAE